MRPQGGVHTKWKKRLRELSQECPNQSLNRVEEHRTPNLENFNSSEVEALLQEVNAK